MKYIYLLIAFASMNAVAQSNSTEWEDWFMPGVGYKTYAPRNSADFGVYHGFTTEFVIYAKAKNGITRRSGPSRIKFYGNLSMMKSTNQEAKDVFFSNIGTNLSFEGTADRNWFIPYFGLEMGGIYKRDYSSFHFTPLAGIQLISSKRIIWSVHAGYQYTTKYFDEYSGYNLGSTFNLLLWEK